MALGTPVDGGAAYSAQGGTSVAPAYPAGVAAGDVLALIVGQKPSTANGGTVTTPSGWTLRSSLTAAGGYGTTLGVDTGNTNLFVYTKDTVAGTESGTLSVTVGQNNVCWAIIVLVPSDGGTISYQGATGQQSTTPTSSLSVSLSSASITAKQGDVLLTAMCIPTDVQTPTQFSSAQTTISGLTVSGGELEEPDSATGNDIGGFVGYDTVTAGSATGTAAFTATLAGTLTNVRGPVVALRINEVVTHATTGSLTGAGSQVSGSAVHLVPHDASGALPGSSAFVQGVASRAAPEHQASGDLSGQTSTLAGEAARGVTRAASGGLVAQGALLDGAAARVPAPHVASGSLVGSGGSVEGSAARWRAFATSGDLAGGGASIAGAGSRVRVFSSAGELAGTGAAVDGAVLRFRTHAAAGDLAGAVAAVGGHAAANSSAVSHDASGALGGLVASVAGQSDRQRVHGFAGQLAGASAILVGEAARLRIHGASGELQAVGALVAGAVAQNKAVTASGVLAGAGSAVQGAALLGDLVIYGSRRLRAQEAERPAPMLDRRTETTASRPQQQIQKRPRNVSPRRR